MEILERYKKRSSAMCGVSFLGRLATYRYMDMHQVIGEALELAGKVAASDAKKEPWPLFSGE